MESFKMTYGKYKGVEITSKSIPTNYLLDLERYLLLEMKESTSNPLMIAIDKEIRRRKKDLKKIYETKKSVSQINLRFGLE